MIVSHASRFINVREFRIHAHERLRLFDAFWFSGNGSGWKLENVRVRSTAILLPAPQSVHQKAVGDTRSEKYGHNERVLALVINIVVVASEIIIQGDRRATMRLVRPPSKFHVDIDRALRHARGQR